MSWIQDGIDATESKATQSLLSIAVERSSDAAALVFLDWVQDGIDGREALAIELLGRPNDSDSTLVLIALPWVKDGIDDDKEVGALALLTDIASRRFRLASAILSLPWVRDGLEERESAAISRLDYIQDMDVLSSVVALGWVRDAIDDDAEVDAIEKLLHIADIDPGLASSVVALAWIQDGIYDADLEVVARLASIGSRDVATAQAVASLGWVQDGMDNDAEVTAIQRLSDISYRNASLAKSLISLGWVQDGIHPDNEHPTIQQLSHLAGKDASLAHSLLSLAWMRDAVDPLETAAVKSIQGTTGVNNLQALISLEWVQDGIDDDAEVSAIQHLSYTSHLDAALAASIISLDWIQDGINGDSEADTIEQLSQLANKDASLAHSVVSLEWMQDHLDGLEARAINWIQSLATVETASSVVSLNWVQDGIGDEAEVDAIQALSYTSSHDTDLTKSIASLGWVQDDLNNLEGEAVQWLSRIAFTAPATASSALSLGWVQDGIDGDMEVNTIKELYEISYRDSETASALVDMPFLESIEPADVAALRTLRLIAAADSEQTFQQVVSSPAMREGITDELAPVIPTLSGLASSNPDLLDALLDPGRVIVETRTIDLPVSGEVVLAIIRTSPGVPRSMSLLEQAVRSIESMMAAPLPTNYVGLLYQDIIPLRAGGVNSGTHIAMRPRYDIDDGSDDAEVAAHLTTHEVAHYYWTGNLAWIDEGMAELLATLVQHDRANYPVEARNWPCPYMRTIVQLEALAPDQRADEFDCNYSLGERIFLDLLRAHGKEQFFTAIRELYARSRTQDTTTTDSGATLGIEHIRQAFPSGNAATATAIDRWYHGTEPYDLSHLDLGPSDPTLPAINGRVDEAYLSGVDIVGWRHFTLEYSYNISKPRVELPLEIMERYEDGFVVRHRTANLTAQNRFTESAQRLFLGPPPSTHDWPAGRYTIQIYHDNRQIADLTYQVTR